MILPLFKTSSEIFVLAVKLYVSFPLSLRNAEDLLHEQGVDVRAIEPPHLNWSTTMFRKRRAENGEQDVA